MSELTRADLTPGDLLVESGQDSEAFWIVENWGLRGIGPGADDWDWQGIESNGGFGILRKSTDTALRLEYLRAELRAERISWGDIAELQGLADEIAPGDVELLEAAGVPEFPEEGS